MTTFVLKKYKVLKTGAEGGHRYLATTIFYCGLEFSLPVFLKDKSAEDAFKDFDVIAVNGSFKEEVNPLSITLYDAEQVALPDGENWLSFFTNYFLENAVECLTISEYSNGYFISPNLEHHSIWIDIAKDKKTVKKIEFGRWLPIEKSEHKRKSTSWTKGVFVRNPKSFVEFMQTSGDGESGKKFKAHYNEANLKLVTDFLSVPFDLGWTEFDYKIGKDAFYKAGAKATVNNLTFQNTFTLLDIGEQDIPFAFVDKAQQWLRTTWADSFINNKKRSVDKTNVNPVKHHG
jgi:hypothetical protein